MLKRTICALLFAAMAIGSAHAAGPTATAQKGVHEAIKTEAQAQAQVEKWERERDSKRGKLRSLESRLEWLRFQEDKLTAYTERQERTLAELERRKLELARIQQELEPWLEDVVASLEQAVQSDLPFLPEERTRRLSFLRDSLDDYKLGSAEKLRRVLEALKVEAEYGRSVEVQERTLDIQGSQTLASVFRLGRAGLYYLTQDGTQAGRWSRVSSSWEPLSTSYVATIRRAVDIAQRKRAAEILDLPVEQAR